MNFNKSNWMKKKELMLERITKLNEAGNQQWMKQKQTKNELAECRLMKPMNELAGKTKKEWANFKLASVWIWAIN